MIGAIVGDMIGSTHEFVDEKSWKGPLFNESSTFTDDTVLTVATANAILLDESYDSQYAAFFKRYSNLNANGVGTPGVGYGAMFTDWAMSSQFYRHPYGSLGNGSAMRVSPVAWAYDDLYEVLVHAQRSADCTHNHIEGVRGAQSVALAVWLARTGMSPDNIQAEVQAFSGYDLEQDLDFLNRNYTFDSTCPGSVPQALACVFQAKDFESTMRNCLYIGGDTDTIAAIAGSIAEPLFGVPDALRNHATEILTRHAPMLSGIVEEFERKYGRRIAAQRSTRSLSKTLRSLLALSRKHAGT